MTTATLSTVHVTRTERGDFVPAPRRAYAVVTILTPIWGDGDRSNKIVATEVSAPLAVWVNAGETLESAVGIASSQGETIYSAIACSREDYNRFHKLEAAKEAVRAALPEVDCW